MKLAVAGKGGVGKTSLVAWLGDYLARQGQDVWAMDADTAPSLGLALGLDMDALPTPLAKQEALVKERMGQGMLRLTPEVEDLPERLAVRIPGVEPGALRLLALGGIHEAGEGCACAAHALLKALLHHLVCDQDDWVLVDMEAGVEHLGRGVIEHVDALLVVAEPGLRSLQTAAQAARMARELGITKQLLVLNRCDAPDAVPQLADLPERRLGLPALPGLVAKQLTDGSVLGLPEQGEVDAFCEAVVEALG